jgi:hypothetical protein
MTRTTLTSLLLAVVCAGAFTACAKKQELTPPPPPLRPEPEPVPEEKKPAVAKDCEPIDPKTQPASITFGERSIPEAQRQTEEARDKLKLAEGAEVDRQLREAYTTDAVKGLLTALAADPYNVTAHYLLAATYARIGRKQCAVNLLGRMLEMRSHASKKAEVDMNLDKLLGRKQQLDPNFADMRRDTNFRTLIQKMCEGSNDPNCVYGAQRDNRER